MLLKGFIETKSGEIVKVNRAQCFCNICGGSIREIPEGLRMLENLEDSTLILFWKDWYKDAKIKHRETLYFHDKKDIRISIDNIKNFWVEES